MDWLFSRFYMRRGWSARNRRNRWRQRVSLSTNKSQFWEIPSFCNSFAPREQTSKTHWFRRLEEKKEKTAFSVWLCTRNKADHSRDFVTSGGPVTEISSLSQKTSTNGKRFKHGDSDSFSWFFRIQTHLLPKRNTTVMKCNSNMQVDGHIQQSLTNQHLQGNLKNQQYPYI